MMPMIAPRMSAGNGLVFLSYSIIKISAESVYASNATIVCETKTVMTVAIAKAIAVNKLGRTNFPLSEKRVSITMTVKTTRAIRTHIVPADTGCILHS